MTSAATEKARPRTRGEHSTSGRAGLERLDPMLNGLAGTLSYAADIQDRVHAYRRSW